MCEGGVDSSTEIAPPCWVPRPNFIRSYSPHTPHQPLPPPDAVSWPMIMRAASSVACRTAGTTSPKQASSSGRM